MLLLCVFRYSPALWFKSFNFPKIETKHWKSCISWADYCCALFSALDICSFSEFKEQTIHFKGLPEFCWKFPSPPCALLSSYRCCWLQPWHQSTLSEAFFSGTSICSKCNYITATFIKKYHFKGGGGGLCNRFVQLPIIKIKRRDEIR